MRDLGYRSLSRAAGVTGVAGSLSRRNVPQYATPARIPPAIGPTIQTNQSLHRPAASAGPNHRAGLSARARPRSERQDGERERESDREPGGLRRTGHGRRRSSRTRPTPGRTSRRPPAGSLCPTRCHRRASVSRRARRRRPEQEPGTSAAAPRPLPRRAAHPGNTTVRMDGIFPVTQRATWIAGLKTPPDRWAICETITAITNPCASATPTRSSCPLRYKMTEPAPKKISANVPTNSATAAFAVALHAFSPRSATRCVRARPSRGAGPPEGSPPQRVSPRREQGCVVRCPPWTSCSSHPIPRPAS